MPRIDTRVVEMKFDNKDFEKNVATSLKTLTNLNNKFDNSTNDVEDLEKAFGNLQKAVDKMDFEGINRGLDDVHKTIDRVLQSMGTDTAAASENMKKSMADVQAAADGVRLDQLESQVGSLTERFSTMGVVGMTVLQNLTTAALNLAKNAISKVAGPVVQGGISRALNIEAAKFQLEGLNVAWDDIKDDINYGVKDTAYGLDVAARAASQLVASGIEVGDSMKQALRGISGVAAMTNTSFEEISPIFTTIAGQGKVMTIQLRQLEIRGMNAAATLAKSLGKTEAQVRDMVTKGQIDFATFSKAMDDAYGPHAKEANKTFTGAMSNMKAALARLGAEFVSPNLNNLRDIFNSLTPIIDNVHEALKPLINDITVGLTNATQKFTAALQNPKVIRFVKNVWRGFQNIGNILGKIGTIIRTEFNLRFADSLKDIGNNVLNLSIKFLEFTKKLKMNKETADNIRNTFSGIVSIFRIFGRAIGDVLTFLFPMGNVLSSIGKTILSITGGIGKTITKFDYWLKTDVKVNESIKNMQKNLRDFFNENDRASRAMTALSKIGNNIKESFKSVGNAIKGLFDKIAQSKGFSDFKEVLNAIGKDIRSGLGTALEYIVRLLEFIADYSISDSKLGQGFKILGEKFKHFGQSISESFKNFKVNLPSLKETYDTMKNMGGTALERISAGVKQFTDEMMKNVSNIKDSNFGMAIISSITGVSAALIGSKMFDMKKMFDFNLKGFFKTIMRFADMIKEGLKTMLIGLDFPKAFRDFFNNLSKTLTEFQNNLKIEQFKQIAKALLLLAGALMVISMIPGDKLIQAGVAIGILMGEMAFIVKALQVNSPDSFGKGFGNMLVIRQIGEMFIKLATSMLLLSLALKIVGSIDTDKLIAGGIALGAILAEMAIIVKMLYSNSLQSGILNNSSAAKELQAMGLIILEMSVSLSIIASAISKIAGFKIENIAVASISLGAILALMVFLINKSKLITMAQAKSMQTMALALDLMSVSVVIIAEAIAKLGAIPIDQLLQGGISVGIIMLAMTGIMKIMDMIAKSNTEAGKIAAMSASMILLAVALNIMVPAIQKMAALDWDGVMKGIVALGGMAIILSIAANIAKSAAPAAVALALLTTSMLPLGLALIIVGGAAPVAAIGMGILLAACAGLAVIGTIADAAALGLLALAAVFTAIGGLALMLAQSFKIVAEAIAIIIQSFTVLAGIFILVGNNSYIFVNGAKAMAAAIFELLPAISSIAALTPAILALSLACGVVALSFRTITASLQGFLTVMLSTTAIVAGAEALAEAFSKLSEEAGAILKTAIAMGLAAPGISAFGSSLTTFGLGIHFFSTSITLLSGSISTMGAAIGVLKTFIKGVGQPLKDLSIYLGYLATMSMPMATFTNSIGGLNTTFLIFNKTLPNINNELKYFCIYLTMLTKIFDNKTNYSKKLEELGEGFKEFSNKLNNVSDRCLKSLKEIANQLARLEWPIYDLGQTLPNFVRSFSNFVNNISKLQKMKTAPEETIKKISESLKEFVEAVDGKKSAVKLLESLAKSLDIIAPALETSSDKVGKFAEGMEELIDVFSNMEEGLDKKINDIADSLGNFNSKTQYLGQRAIDMDALADSMNKMGTSISDFGYSIWHSGGTTFAQAIDSFVFAIQDKMEPIKSSLTELGKAFEDFTASNGGLDIFKSIMNGMDGVIDAIGNSAENSSGKIDSLRHNLNQLSLSSAKYSKMKDNLILIAEGLGKIFENTRSYGSIVGYIGQFAGYVESLSQYADTAGNGVTKLDRSFRWISSTLTDNAQSISENIVTVFESVNQVYQENFEAMGSLNGVLGEFERALGGVTTSLTDFDAPITQITTAILDLYDAVSNYPLIINGLNFIKFYLDEYRNDAGIGEYIYITNFTESMKELSGVIDDVNQHIVTVNDIRQYTQDLFSQATSDIQTYTEAMASFTDIEPNFVWSMNKVKGVFRDNMDTILENMDKFEEKFKNLLDHINETSVNELFAGNFRLFVNDMNELGSYAADADASIGWLQNSLKQLNDSLTSSQAMHDNILMVRDALVDIINYNDSINNLSSYLDNIATAMGRIASYPDAAVQMSNVATSIGEILNVIPDTTTTTDPITSFLNALSNALTTFNNSSINETRGFIDLLKESFDSFSTTLVDLTTNITDLMLTKESLSAYKITFSDLYEYLVNTCPEIIQQFLDMCDNIVSNANDYVELFYDCGKNLIMGFADGIVDSEAAQSVRDNATKVANEAQTILKNALQEKSPSRIGKDIGRNLTLGLAIGIIDAADQVSTNADKVAQIALTSIETPNNINPVITPIMDLSNIQNGITSMNSMFERSQYAAAGYSNMINARNAKITLDQTNANKLNASYANALVEAVNSIGATDTNVNVVLAGDAAGVFKLVRTENSKFVKSTGYAPLAQRR